MGCSVQAVCSGLQRLLWGITYGGLHAGTAGCRGYSRLQRSFTNGAGDYGKLQGVQQVTASYRGYCLLL